MPMSAMRILLKLRRSNPAPANKTSEMPISATTRTSRRWRRQPVELTTAGAQHRTQSDLTLATGGPRQQEIGNIDACHQQNRCDRAQQKYKLRPRRSYDLL